MSVPRVVEEFYSRIWERGDLSAAERLVAGDVVFRGSLGPDMRGREKFLDYVRTVRSALSDYRCEILACVSDVGQGGSGRAFARMRFSGVHVGRLLGYDGTGNHIAWEGAALFEIERGVIAEVWVLGDVKGLETLLAENAAGKK